MLEKCVYLALFIMMMTAPFTYAIKNYGLLDRFVNIYTFSVFFSVSVLIFCTLGNVADFHLWKIRLLAV